MLPFTLDQLRILKAVETEQNFTKASELVYLSQPSLSKQVRGLEKNLNLILINREQNQMSLTGNGKIFLRYAERILALGEESCRALVDFKHGERGSLMVGASQTIGMYLLPQVLALFAQRYPQINLNVYVNSTRLIAKSVINRETNIAIVGGDIPNKMKKKLRVEDFAEDEFSLIVSKDHPFAKKKVIRKEDLYHLKFIALNSSSTIRKFIDHILIQNQIQTKQLKIIMQLNSIEGIKTAVGLGLGAAFISSSAIEKEIKLKTVQILKIKNIQISRKLSIITSHDSYQSKAFEFFYKELLKLKDNSKKVDD